MMVSREIPHQARLFLLALATGAGMLLIYDLFRIVRRVIRHGTAAIAVEDMCFWIGCACWMFRLMCRENDGSIRGFVIIGAGVGMLLYCMLLSRLIVRGGAAAFGFLVNILAKIFGFLTAPFRFLGRQAGKSIVFWGRLCKKRGRGAKKRLKKIWKAIKIGLCKL